MLILGRRVGESIVIEGGIRIVVLASDRRGVRLGIEAPEQVSIVRGEIVSQIESENRRATATAEVAVPRDLLPNPGGAPSKPAASGPEDVGGSASGAVPPTTKRE